MTTQRECSFATPALLIQTQALLSWNSGEKDSCPQRWSGTGSLLSMKSVAPSPTFNSLKGTSYLFSTNVHRVRIEGLEIEIERLFLEPLKNIQKSHAISSI